MARKTVKTKRRNNEGSIVWDEARQKWRASVTAPDGSRPQKRFDDWPDADKWLTKIKNSFIENSYVPSSDVTLGKWILDWLSHYIKGTVRDKTFSRYRQTAAHMSPIAGLKLQDVTTPDVQQFLNELPPMSDSSKNKIYKQLVSVFEKAKSLRMISVNPMIEVPYVKVAEEEIEIFTWFEIRKIIGKLTLPKTPKYFKKYYPLILLAVTTGMRLGEISGLKTKYLVLQRNQLYVRNSLQEVDGKLLDCDPKTKAGKRTLPLLQETVKMLYWQLDQRVIIKPDGSEYVFQTSKGTPLWPKNINRVWHKILEYCDVPYKNFHVLRHTYATEMLEAGAPLLEVAAKMGHSDPSYTLKLYGHAIPGYTGEYLNKMESLIS